MSMRVRINAYVFPPKSPCSHHFKIDKYSNIYLSILDKLCFGNLKASSLMPDLNRLIIVTSEGSLSRHPAHPEIELIPIDIFLLKGLA